MALPGVTEAALADAAQLASLADETPEGRSIVVLAKEQYGLRGRELASHQAAFIPFTAQTRMSGVDLDGRVDPQGRRRRDRPLPAVARAAPVAPELKGMVERIARNGGTPLVVAEDRPRRSASSTSRTSSRAACASASRSCAAWASGR